MPVYVDNAQNRKLNRVGKTWGKKVKKKSVPYSPSLIGGVGDTLQKQQKKNENIIKKMIIANQKLADTGEAFENKIVLIPIVHAGGFIQYKPSMTMKEIDETPGLKTLPLKHKMQYLAKGKVYPEPESEQGYEGL
tara:strand:- start:31 stop:435 length:405 start_codon:yes stop_codon:yes gene_type:complete